MRADELPYVPLPAHRQRLTTGVDLDADSVERDSGRLAVEVERILDRRRAEHDLGTLERLRAGQPHGLARQGVDGVVAALQAAQVDTLVVTDPALADRHVWLSDDLSLIAPDREAGARRQRADEALPVVAVATAADIQVLTGEAKLDDGVGALLRYP